MRKSDYANQVSTCVLMGHYAKNYTDVTPLHVLLPLPPSSVLNATAMSIKTGFTGHISILTCNSYEQKLVAQEGVLVPLTL